ncbi:hypothetical protein NP233_g736 [Leucocoprinus birnbaumii]|uniref:LYR motif-containing protein Cup1-like N-terminal domain-containing protein n=1 Tax=Leucocoprinus birnbaumii TaxID=56174 RepID=A0AAD5YVH8_9AGAR|nr:hypothetical protein NP233_g736 [Leucocoprinus birnbaumii]
MLEPTSLLILYRGYLRAIRQLPHTYLRQFYQLKVRDDIENVKSTKDPKLQCKKYGRVAKEFRRMTRGLQGDWRSFEHVLDIAYGRKGKLKHELLEPFLSDPNAQVPPPIIPEVPSSRPPVYSPELRALLTSDVSRTTKALKPSDFTKPSVQRVPQADRTSKEAQLWGGLSKRREKNILQRFFRHEIQKVYPPLEVNIKDGRTPEQAGVRGGGMQGLDLQKDIEAIVGPTWSTPQLTRRERRAQDPAQIQSCEKRPTRWLRRRYQALLRRLPVLTFTPRPKTGIGHYVVESPPQALGDLYSTRGRLLPVAAADQLAWFDLGAKPPEAKGKKGAAVPVDREL